MKRWANRLSWITSIIVLGSSLPAGARTLEGVSGEVLVNSGSGFKPASESAPLSSGDLVMVRPGGTAVVHYQDACYQSVKPGVVVKVGVDGPCDLFEQKNGPGPSQASSAYPGGGAAGGEVGGVGGEAGGIGGGAGGLGGGAGAAGIGSGLGALGPTTIAIGAGVATAIGAGVIISQQNSSRSASP